jgi:hydroxymethylglutaryl-CoA reductase
MVTEESSVVAASSAAAKFWASHGGFNIHVRNKTKPGHIHFIWSGSEAQLQSFVTNVSPELLESAGHLTRNMELRGGGVNSISLIDLTDKIPGYHQLEVLFGTVDSMGANFINSCLESMSAALSEEAEKEFPGKLEIVMSILSNHIPDCVVECAVTCKTDDLEIPTFHLTGLEFARRFVLAVDMARENVSRAVTHNKGIFNGVDAVVLATGNDFRAVEAGGHAYASRDGIYRSLSKAEIAGPDFRFSLELPLSIGTVGGLTRNHPMAATAIKILGNPDAEELMGIVAAAGLANNFSAIKALITGGIQQGHMRLHLPNLLNHLHATPEEKTMVLKHFRDRKVSHAAVGEYLTLVRSSKQGKQ